MKGSLNIQNVEDGYHIKATGPTRDQLDVFVEALRVYDQKNKKYKDNWKRMGWRGALIRLRERIERAWDYLWDYEESRHPEGQVAVDAPDPDDVIDMINFAGFLVRGVRGEATRDGSWW